MIVCDHVDIFCPGCKRAIVDVRFERDDDGGRVSIEHELPPCAWWSTPSAKRWAISIVTDAITQKEADA